MLDFISKVNYIIQNANMLKPSHSEIHPWHLHGHDFWVFRIEPHLHMGMGAVFAEDVERVRCILK
ncbi:hypothetical protein WN944_009731 [Citrus x changshan-huyou]|uniref:Plastocyanin-like domain-containing protein n=1 Tax=Citrus x changshan-huyou TaxID=2935761 RepID=A0AAP0QSA7_9ROSI